MAIFPGSAIPSAVSDYEIDNSLRFNDGDSAYLARTPGSAGNRKTWTFSAWVKRSLLGSSQHIFDAYSDASNRTFINIDSSDLLGFKSITGGSTDFHLQTTQVFRDPSAWYNIVVKYDSTPATPGSSNVALYVNGSQVTALGTESYPSQNDETWVNNTVAHAVGRYGGGSAYLDGYLAEVYFIDGTALAPSDFGELSSTTNQWIPKDAKDDLTFGTNGFYQKYGGTELADSFTDSDYHSINTVTASGDVHTDTSVKKIGTASAQFDGVYPAPTGEFLTVSSSGDWDIQGATVDYTIEFWFRVSSWPTDPPGSAGLFSFGSASQSDPYSSNFVVINPGNDDLIWGVNSQSQDVRVVDWMTSASLDTWYHMALVSDNGTAKMYIDGVVQSDTETAQNITDSGTFHIGSKGPDRPLDGYIDEFRISVGICRYTSNFTPSTTEFTADKYTKLLLHMDGADDGTTFTDSSWTGTGGVGHTITANGDVTNTRAVRKIGDSSIKFDGTGDYLSIPHSSDWDFGTGNYTVELWFKRASAAGGTIEFLIDHDEGANYGWGMRFKSGDDTIEWSDTSSNLSSTTAFTDTDWHHIAAVREGTGSNEFVLYVDGVAEATGTSTTDISLDESVTIGIRNSLANPFDGYMDEIRISNSARYTGTFTPQTTPFTADANTKLLIHSNWDGGLGADSSGNYNTFTPTNLVATDQMVDTPTNNFATWNPIGSNDLIPLTEGNLVCAGTDDSGMNGTFGMSDGKWYWESYIDTTNSYSPYCGITIYSMEKDAGSSPNFETANTHSTAGSGNTHDYTQTGGTSSSYFQDSADYIIAYALDLENGTMKYYEDNVLRHTDSTIPTDGSVTFFPFIGMTTSGGPGWHNSYWNFGADSSFGGLKTSGSAAAQDDNEKGDFYYEPPSGFLALCTDNLSDPEIALPGENFNTVLYTGDGAADHAITGVGFQPDLTWIKMRSSTGQHLLFDANRGADHYLVSNNDEEDKTDTTSLISFDSDGFSVGSGYHGNSNLATFASWNWKAGGTPTADNDNTTGAMDANSVALNGSLQAAYTPSGSPSIYPSKMSINTTSGFSIVEYTGHGSTTGTIPHGLGLKPDLIITKYLSGSASWSVYNSPQGATKVIWLDDNSAEGTGITYWRDTEPTTDVFSVGASGTTGGNANPYIAYCFKSIEGYSKVGSYEGNGNADGTFVYTGFRPAFWMTKRTDVASPWRLFDDKRPTYNAQTYKLQADDNGAELTGYPYADFLSNGFKVRDSGAYQNASGGTYVYLAFAESPFKTSNAR